MPDLNGSLPTAPATNTFNGGDDAFLQIWAPPSLPDEQEAGEPTEEEPTELEAFAEPPAEPTETPTEKPAEAPAAPVEVPAAPVEAPAAPVEVPAVPISPTWQPGSFARYRGQIIRISTIDDPSFFGAYVEFASDGRLRTCRNITGGGALYTLSPITNDVTLAQIQIALLYEQFDAVDKEAQRLANEIDTAEVALRDYQDAKKRLHRLLGIQA